jgi:DNA-binding SARP family transcriptional activator/predicted Ser/Thr protein kinase
MIRLEVLGGLRVFQNGEELPALPSKPQRCALLVYLAVEGEATRDRLCYLLWPESDPKDARHALSQTLSELKRELGDAWLDVVGERISTTSETDVDVHALHQALEESRYLQALELYRGPFLDGTRLGGGVDFERWIEGKRSQLHRGVRIAFRAAAESESAPEARVRLTRAWVALDPLDDESQHALIESLAAAGDRTEALSCFQQYELLIRTELDLEPMDDTRELVKLIKSGASLQAPAPPPTHHDPDSGSQSPHPGIRRPGIPDLGPDLNVLRELGSGATGTVYLAREPALRRLVAVKVLDAELARDATARARFEREAQSAGRILHPHVAMVIRVGVTPDDRPFHTMPYIRGVTLADRLRAQGRMTANEVRRVLSETASALAAAHSMGVIHRDVRPANVLYEDETGRTYLVDFGIAGVLEDAGEEIARLTRTGELLGNPEYVSPEQREGRPLDGRSDVYSWGVLGFELVFGDPRPRRDAVAAARAAAEHVGDGMAKHTDMLHLLGRATAEIASHRPTAAELAEALSRDVDEPRPRRGLLELLKERRMLPIVTAYLAGGAVAMGGIDQLVQQELLGPLAYRLALALFVAGLNATIILSWYHGPKGRQEVSRSEVALLTVVFVAWVIATALLAS